TERLNQERAIFVAYLLKPLAFLQIIVTIRQAKAILDYAEDISRAVLFVHIESATPYQVKTQRMLFGNECRQTGRILYGINLFQKRTHGRNTLFDYVLLVHGRTIKLFGQRGSVRRVFGVRRFEPGAQEFDIIVTYLSKRPQARLTIRDRVRRQPFSVYMHIKIITGTDSFSCLSSKIGSIFGCHHSIVSLPAVSSDGRCTWVPELNLRHYLPKFSRTR